MGPDTWTALTILLVAVLPGSVYTWAFERQAGSFGVSLSDRVLRFIAISLALHLVLGWGEFFVYRHSISAHSINAGEFAWGWGGLIVITAIPALAGTVAGGLYATRTSRTGWEWLRSHVLKTQERETRFLSIMIGRDPAPRAWDDLFSERPVAWLRVQLDDGSWVGGAFAEDSYAAGFPQDADLLIEEAWELDREHGLEFVRALGYRLYIPAGKMRFVEVLPAEGERG